MSEAVRRGLGACVAGKGNRFGCVMMGGGARIVCLGGRGKWGRETIMKQKKKGSGYVCGRKAQGVVCMCGMKGKGDWEIVWETKTRGTELCVGGRGKEREGEGQRT